VIYDDKRTVDGKRNTSVLYLSSGVAILSYADTLTLGDPNAIYVCERSL